MLDLSNLSKFQLDIQRNHVTVYPLIILGTDTSDPVYISSVKEVMLNEEGGSPLDFKDYNLAISNIKESINVDTHAFNISNVTLTLNNYEQNGQRLSDILLDKTNKGVDVYYKTQSCNTLTDCLLVYKGIVKRITHDDSKLSISLEDLTDTTFSKDVPVANLGFGENVFNKDYINRPIPITYGEVDKAPVVPWVDVVGTSGKTNLSIIADDVEVVTGSGRDISINDFGSSKIKKEVNFETGYNFDNVDSNLYIYKDDYFLVLPKLNQETMQDSEMFYSEPDQYSYSDDRQFISIEKMFKASFPVNPPAHNEFQAVKLFRPNQAEIVISDGGVAEEGNVGSIINLDSTILNPLACLDGEDNPTLFINTGQQGETSTFTQIPNNQLTAEDFNEDFVTVNMFNNFDENSNFAGIWYPDIANSFGWTQNTNYLWIINAWIQSNAHHLNIRFINPPSGGMIIDKCNDKLNLGLIFKCYDESPENKVRLYHQYALNDNFKQAWINSCSGIQGNIDLYESMVNEGAFTGDFLDYNESAFSIVLKEIFTYENSSTFYPTTVYKIECIENEEGVDTVYVGQWNETTMGGALQSNERWFNLFEDESTDKDFLFKSEECASFTPQQLMAKYNTNVPSGYINLKRHSISTRYKSKYNSVPIGTLNGNNFSNNVGYISNDNFSGTYGFRYTGAGNESMHALVKMQEMCDKNSWWMLIDEEIPKGDTLLNLSPTSQDLGEYTDTICKTTIPKGTFIPCVSKVSLNYTGQNFNYNFIEEQGNDRVVLRAGNATDTPEQRLAVFFPFSDMKGSDAIDGETNTFVYGQVRLNIETNDESNTFHNTNSDDNILLQAYATSEIDEELVDYNSEFVGDTDWGTNLIDIQGANDPNHGNIFTNGGVVEWQTLSNSEFMSGLTQSEIFNKNRIGDWASPSDYNSLSLVYRIRNDEGRTDAKTSISTGISTIGVIQYSIFSNVFKDQMFASVYGRNDVNQKYTMSGGVAENPADVLYHFVEKELGVVDKTNRESWSLANSINSDIKLAFSVKEKINSKTIVQNIAKNTRLFPKFNYNGEFSYSNIAETYSTSQETIKQSDVIDFSFTRTLSENIKTLVNVKYKKDYATDEYTRETGYCDGYDFFGNGENNKEVYKVVDGVEQWSNKGYNYNLLGLKRDDNILEFESEFIRDYESARRLRDYIYLLHCNQHTIVKCTLPLKYIKLEVGDVVDFDSLNNNTKAFGEDYTKPNTRNGQRIYPLFIITSLTKSSKNIKIECMQLHELKGDFTVGQGSLSRRSILGISADSEYVNEHITFEDINIYEDIIAGLNNYLTSSQKLSADLNNDGVVDQYDLTALQMLISDTNFIAGDIDGDGLVNVSDIVAIINYILEYEQPNESQLIASDLNEDGIINVIDITAIVAMIFES